MHNTSFADRLLTLASTPQRASEIIGDLLEQNSSPLRFWFTITCILATLTWRWSFGFVLAALSSAAVLLPYAQFVLPRHYSGHRELWMPWSTWLVIAALCIGTNVALVAARFGRRHPLTWLSTSIWIVTILCACSSWRPHALKMISFTLAAVLFALLLSRVTRPLLLCVLLPTLGYATTTACFLLLSQHTSIPYTSTSLVANELFGLVTFLSSLFVEAVLLARLHSIFFPQQLAPTDI